MKQENIISAIAQCDKKIEKLQAQLDVYIKRRQTLMLESVMDTLEANEMSIQDFFNLVDKEKKKPITNDFRGDKNI